MSHWSPALEPKRGMFVVLESSAKIKDEGGKTMTIPRRKESLSWCYRNRAENHTKSANILQGSLQKGIVLEKAGGSRRRGRQNIGWIDSVKEATEYNLEWERSSNCVCVEG